ncbi:helix-turn-helix domain-containing protein [Rhodococcus qingshengii]|uniref:helix-turn-helix domain-containing protein n=1 Tax=Rhodococcus qingshengii TaxID=334542 RepID=UPI001AE0CFF9|nr:helix-turn-helix transcriptional regulator [Rhodococcus qingshengii]
MMSLLLVMKFASPSGTSDNQQGNVITMNEVDSLQGLIGKARRERNTSIRQLAMQAQTAGHKIVGTTLNAIESGTYKSTPSDETIRAIAWLAGVDEETAFMAAGRRVPGPPFAAELPPGVDDLSPKEREAVIGLLRVLVAQRQEIDHEDESTQDSTSDPTTHGEAGLGGTSITWHGKTPEQMTDEELREAAAVDTVWVEYIRTRKPLNQSNDWDY